MNRVIKATFGAGKGMPVDLMRFDPSEVAKSRKSASFASCPSPADERAKLEADVIVRTARAEAEALHEQARQEGYEAGRQAGMEDGYRAGVAEAVQQTQALVQRLEADIIAAAEEEQAFFDSIEPELLKLCLKSVEKIVRHEARTDPRVVTRVIKSCLRRVKESEEVRVRVNPGEVAEVRAQRDELLRLAEGVRAINIVDDRRISEGGCVIETATGDFDATVETQLEVIQEKLTETFENGRCQDCSGPGEIPQGD